MESFFFAVLAVLVLVTAAFYASIGHGGASGYLAAMALMGVAPDAMKPIALALNVLVAAIGTFKFYRAGHFSWGTFWPFTVLSVPLAFLGGTLTLAAVYYRPLVGAVLLFAAYKLIRSAAAPSPEAVRALPKSAALPVGAGIGFLSGLTGVGGGIFLSPILLLTGWANVRTTAAVSAAFILVNSAAGLAGHVTQGAGIPSILSVLALAAVVGGWLGASVGSRYASPAAMRYVLGIILIIAGLKMIVLP